MARLHTKIGSQHTHTNSFNPIPYIYLLMLLHTSSGTTTATCTGIDGGICVERLHRIGRGVWGTIGEMFSITAIVYIYLNLFGMQVAWSVGRFGAFAFCIYGEKLYLYNSEFV